MGTLLSSCIEGPINQSAAAEADRGVMGALGGAQYPSAWYGLHCPLSSRPAEVWQSCLSGTWHPPSSVNSQAFGHYDISTGRTLMIVTGAGSLRAHPFVHDGIFRFPCISRISRRWGCGLGWWGTLPGCHRYKYAVYGAATESYGAPLSRANAQPQTAGLSEDARFYSFHIPGAEHIMTFDLLPLPSLLLGEAWSRGPRRAAKACASSERTWPGRYR